MPSSESPAAISAFISRWSTGEGGQERANYSLFLTELCDLIGVDRPDPATADASRNAYCFERGVKFLDPEGAITNGRIDLYRRGSFVLEAKQSRKPGSEKYSELGLDTAQMPAPTAQKDRFSRRWDVLMVNARSQAKKYAEALPAADGWPPFIIVCDIGYCIELFADFTGQGKNYAQFPDRKSFRIFMDDLHDDKIRERLRLIWNDPHKLDPAKQSARVTREVAARIASVSKHLEALRDAKGRPLHDPEQVALFLMRCLFTMFAEDIELLPRGSFRTVLDKCRKEPKLFQRLVSQLWEAMDTGGFAYALETDVMRFNGKLFKDRRVFDLPAEEIGELFEAARADWRQVEPAIFGTLLEQALNPEERRKLGAHYTPRAYVEQVVNATLIEPLRAEWDNVCTTADGLRTAGDEKAAIRQVTDFQKKLRETIVLDPACGTGNFLYVSLELMKRLEGEVLDALASLGEQMFNEVDSITPRQFVGIEINPRAAAITELVLWIGYLQWWFRTHSGKPDQPIMQ
ncbi:MAG: hypothetical protein JWN07_2882, partial [Hyphomicrobiales bacterium]|nr:hypothetical protein [Hyphomicrobiales bacterium]